MSDRWQSHIDREIQKALQNGEMENLPGAGKPLNLHDDPNVPDDMRMAYRVMAQNGVAPDWIEQGKYLEAREKQIRTRLAQAARYYREAQADLKHIAPAKAEALRENTEQVWQSAQRSIKRMVDEYNDQILSFNLKAPRSIKHRHIFDLPKEIAKLLRD